MKQSLLLIVLLGFGSLVPFTCSKVKAPKEEAKKEESTTKQQMALYGPVVKVATQSKA
jgi:hypothetical protein